jgi:hypothetical protein
MHDQGSRLAEASPAAGSARVRLITSGDVGELRQLAPTRDADARDAKQQLAVLQAAYANLLAAARAALAAHRDGEAEPWSYLEHELAENAQLAAEGQRTPQPMGDAAVLDFLVNGAARRR